MKLDSGDKVVVGGAFTTNEAMETVKFSRFTGYANVLTDFSRSH